MRSLFTALAICALVIPATAQTVGVAGSNDFTVNGNGAGAASCVSTTIVSNFNMSISAVPGAVLLGTYSTACGPNVAIGAATGTLDLSLAGLTFWIDGTSGIVSTPLNQFAVADASGNWSLGVSTSSIPGGTSLGAWQFAVIGASYGPSGFDVTQAHAVATSSASCPILSNGASIVDDGVQNVVLASGPFGFYGTSYTSVDISDNGYITLGGMDDGDFSALGTSLNNNIPRICPLWSDFDPVQNATTVISYVEAGGFLSVSWNDISIWGATTADSNTFCATLDLTTGTITTTVAQAQLDGDTHDSLVGIGPGMALSSALGINLSTVATTPFTGAGVMDSVYEEFLNIIPGTNPFDLTGTTLTFMPGNPGAGPYSVF